MSRATLQEAEGETESSISYNSSASFSPSSSSSSSLLSFSTALPATTTTTTATPTTPTTTIPATNTTTDAIGGSGGSVARPNYAEQTPCRWYMAGYCRRGEACWFSHDRAVINAAYRGDFDGGDDYEYDDEHTGGGLVRSETTATTTANGDATGTGVEEEDMKCAICFEIPSTFGLLECIRTWRSKQITEDMTPHERNSSVTKACPNCRTPSLYVIPSSFFPTCAEQKEIIMQNYKEATARTPCRYFRESGDRHWCPFGNECFFAHLGSNGQHCDVNPASNPRLLRREREIHRQHQHYQRRYQQPQQQLWQRWGARRHDFQVRNDIQQLMSLRNMVVDPQGQLEEGLRALLLGLRRVSLGPGDYVLGNGGSAALGEYYDPSGDDDDDNDEHDYASGGDEDLADEDFDDDDEYDGDDDIVYRNHSFEQELYLESDYDDY
ncbi:hypothetical protein BGZ83_007567 [Gryganskiella cystojenkinii]|nr:hypothetical protein BGZ83_007567 [Gryganskiella cystojenkinii]